MADKVTLFLDSWYIFLSNWTYVSILTLRDFFHREADHDLLGITYGLILALQQFHLSILGQTEARSNFLDLKQHFNFWIERTFLLYWNLELLAAHAVLTWDRLSRTLTLVWCSAHHLFLWWHNLFCVFCFQVSSLLCQLMYRIK